MKKNLIYLLIVISFSLPSFAFAVYPSTWKEATGEDPWVAEQRMRTKNVQLYVDVANKHPNRMLEAYRSSDADFHLLGAIYITVNFSSPEYTIDSRQFAKQLTPTEYKDIYGVDLYSTNWWKEERNNLALGGVPYRLVIGKGNAPLVEGDIYEQMLPKAGSGGWPGGPKLGNAFDPNFKLPIPAPTWAEYQRYGNMDDPNLPMWAQRYGWPYTPPAPVTANIVSTKFKIGDSVKTTSDVNVRSTPNGIVLGQQAANSRGSVIDGPENAGGYTWWKINYQSGVDGWSAENYLVPSTLSLLATPTTPPANQNITFTGQATSPQSQIKSSSEATSSSKGCFKYPDGSVIAQNMSDVEENYCIYLAKVSAEQQAKNYKRMGDVLAQYPDWKKCAADASELRSVNSRLGYFGDILWQPPALGSSNYELYQKCKDAVEVLQYINKNRFEIHPAVWFYEKGFWIGVSNIVTPVWPPSDCVSCLSSSRATLNTDYNPSVSNLVAPSTLKTPASISAPSAPTGRPTTSVPSYLGATPIERYPALSEAAIAQAQNSSDPYMGLKYKEVSPQALSSQEKTAVYAYIDDSSDLSTNPQQYFSPCGSLMTQYKTTGSVFLGRGPVYRSALNTCSSINSSFVPDDSSVRSYACENFLYKSRVVGRATFAFQCKASN